MHTIFAPGLRTNMCAHTYTATCQNAFVALFEAGGDGHHDDRNTKPRSAPSQHAGKHTPFGHTRTPTLHPTRLWTFETLLETPFIKIWNIFHKLGDCPRHGTSKPFCHAYRHHQFCGQQCGRRVTFNWHWRLRAGQDTDGNKAKHVLRKATDG